MNEIVLAQLLVSKIWWMVLMKRLKIDLEVDDKTNNVAMVENYRLKEDGSRDRFDFEKDG